MKVHPQFVVDAGQFRERVAENESTQRIAFLNDARDALQQILQESFGGSRMRPEAVEICWEWIFTGEEAGNDGARRDGPS